MRKIAVIFISFLLLSNLFVSNVLAAITEAEVYTVLTEKGMDRETLQDMLDYYEYSLEDFESTEDLSMFIGTPITPESIQQLLTDYGMTREELDALLAEYGSSVEEEWSIEDIEIALDFYQGHESEMASLEEFLDAVGLTEDEIHTLFAHFEALDQLSLEQQMENIGTRLEALMMLDPEAELTDEQKQEIISVWEDMIAILNVSPTFYLVDAGGTRNPITFGELAMMEEFDGNGLLIELYTLSGDLLLDMQVSAEMLSGDFAINAGEKLTDVGDIAGELTILKHERMPDTASTYGLNILLGLFIVFVGISLLVIRNKSVKQVE
ncbi:processed acidic surface protein [Cytobacillus sp. FJAT-54145]|uniref:Processed acidic surface protein n=1 Tax=Cytobacillus spartinae TaxID=3299023 RepID=A0ABW6K8M2_9BACI